MFKKADKVDDTLPTPQELDAALSCDVETSTGESLPLSHFVKPQPQDGAAAAKKRTLLTFVRHHRCGICHEFIRALGKDAFLASLSTDPEAASKYQVIIVGHGPWRGIETYKQRSDCKFEMVVDHEAKGAYRQLGLTRSTLTGSSLFPSYMNDKSVVSVAAHSTFNVVADAIKGAPGGGIKDLGDVGLLGGDFIIDEEGNCTFCHRMTSTTDHTDVAKLSALLKGE